VVINKQMHLAGAVHALVKGPWRAEESGPKMAWAVPKPSYQGDSCLGISQHLRRSFSFGLLMAFTAKIVCPTVLPDNHNSTTSQLFSHTYTDMDTDTIVDVFIVGGGPSGLAAALGLYRAQYAAIVFDSGVYRNAPTQHMHTVPT
jgi:hypothetical protein